MSKIEKPRFSIVKKESDKGDAENEMKFNLNDKVVRLNDPMLTCKRVLTIIAVNSDNTYLLSSLEYVTAKEIQLVYFEDV